MLSVYRNRYRFTCKVIPTLITLLGIAILCSLGIWQLHRAEEKRGIIEQFNQRTNMPPLTLNGLINYHENINYLPLKVTGYYDNQHQYLLDNKMQNHQVGFEVITPLTTANKQIVLINRGWIIGNTDRKILPKLKEVNSKQHIIGRVNIPSQMLILNHKESNNTGWPRIIQNIDVQKIAGQLNNNVYPFIVRLNANQPNGYARQWMPTVMMPQKHLGYAVQWFALAAALFIFFICINLERCHANKQ